MSSLTFVPAPVWNGLHPLVVHFPIVLLFVPPLLILVGLLTRRAKPLWLTALGLMVLGTAAIFAATITGTISQDWAAAYTPQAAAIIQQHDAMGRNVLIVFSLLTALYAGLLVLAGCLPQPGAGPPRVPSRLAVAGLQLVFLVFYAGGGLALIHTAHQGGRLVHEFGVRVPIGDQPPAMVSSVQP